MKVNVTINYYDHRAEAGSVEPYASESWICDGTETTLSSIAETLTAHDFVGQCIGHWGPRGMRSAHRHRKNPYMQAVVTVEHNSKEEP